MASMTTIEWSTLEEKYLVSLGNGGDLLGIDKVEKHRLHTHVKASEFLISNVGFDVLALVKQIEGTCR
ncbi:hypothetical protein CDL15_Pgr005957 [Punica granatum]|uniref:Uncharacterized protein n=1 Tax=Punica granatum TaxID=22663 RepID=A0A218WH13_PUNGR|nr:hypothetical protein CDL15_Pgr005957 [Punica granatum]